MFYQFQVRAMNMAGVSEASLPSAALECKEWTITVAGMRDNMIIERKQLHDYQPMGRELIGNY